MSRVILIIVIGLMSVLLLAACGGGGQEKAQEEKAQQPATTEKAEGTIEAPEDEQLDCQIEQATAGMSEEEAVSYEEAVFGQAKDKLGFVEKAKTKEQAQERLPQLQAEQSRILAERGFTC